MFNLYENTMFIESEKSGRKFRPIITVLLFFLVFLICQEVESIVLFAPITVWLFDAITPLLSSGGNMLDLFSGTMQILNNMPDWLLLCTLFATAVCTVVVILFCRKIERRSYSSIGMVKKNFALRYAVGFAVGAAMILSAFGICAAFGCITISVSPAISLPYVILFLLGYIIQGMSEEFLVRGYFMMSFMKSMKSKNRALISVIVSSALFAALHIFNPGMTPLSFINLFLSGVFFAFFVLRTDNIWGACAAHSAWNFVQGNVLGVRVSGLSMQNSIFTTVNTGNSFINGGDFGLEGGIAVMIVEIVAILLVLFLPRKKSSQENASDF